jgi:hypothetical protein
VAGRKHACGAERSGIGQTVYIALQVTSEEQALAEAPAPNRPTAGLLSKTTRVVRSGPFLTKDGGRAGAEVFTSHKPGSGDLALADALCCRCPGPTRVRSLRRVDASWSP